MRLMTSITCHQDDESEFCLALRSDTLLFVVVWVQKRLFGQVGKGWMGLEMVLIGSFSDAEPHSPQLVCQCVIRTHVTYRAPVVSYYGISMSDRR